MNDYLIVGSGIYGAVFAHEMTKKGKKCLVIDRRNHIGGNCYTEEIENIQVHKYGGHIFNTNNDKVWNYINSFCEFEQYTHRVKVNYKGKIFSFPINLFTLYQLWGCTTPAEAIALINPKKTNPKNLEDWVISEVGEEIFEIFYKGYSTKQWGIPCKDIPCSIGKRLPIRLTYDDRYHDTKYCGIPKNGDYTQIFHRLLDGIEVKQADFFTNWQSLAKKLVYSGSIDELFDYCYGPLPYRSLTFDTKVLETDNFQGSAQINYTDIDIPYTRIWEHKWFSPKITKKTVVSYEYPCSLEEGKERYYPINSELYQKYYQKAKNNGILVGGRLGRHKYLDMDICISMALKDAGEQ